MLDNNTPLAEPVAPDGQQQDVKAKITYTPEQQEHINSLIKDAQSRAARELRAENVRLKAEAAARAAAPPVAEDLSLRLAETQAELTALRSEKQTNLTRETLRAACGQQFLDNDLAVRLLADNVKVIDGAVRAVDDAGNLRLNSNFEPMTLRELATELAAAKPFLARAEVRGGAGSKPGTGYPSNAVPLERLFGKNSNGGEANRLAMHDQQTYKRLKAAAREKGLI